MFQLSPNSWARDATVAGGDRKSGAQEGHPGRGAGSAWVCAFDMGARVPLGRHGGWLGGAATGALCSRRTLPSRQKQLQGSTMRVPSCCGWFSNVSVTHACLQVPGTPRDLLLMSEFSGEHSQLNGGSFLPVAHWKAFSPVLRVGWGLGQCGVACCQ